MVKRLRIDEKEYELEKDMSCEEVKGLSEFLYIDNLKKEINQLKQENEQLKEKVKKLEELVTRTEEEKEHFADLILKRGFGNLFGKVSIDK